MSVEKMREQFEAWARDQGYCLRRTTWDGADYVEHGAESAWLVWLASRAALPSAGHQQPNRRRCLQEKGKVQPIDFTKVSFNTRTADKFVLRMPEGMRSAVEDAAAAQFGSMNSYMLQAIAEKLDRDQRAKVAVDALAAQAEQRGAL